MKGEDKTKGQPIHELVELRQRVEDLETCLDMRKRAEEALQVSEMQLRETKDYLDDIIKSSADAIAVVDMEGRVRSWNKAAEDYMGYTAAEVIGRSNKKFFADPEEADRIMEVVLRAGELKNYRTVVLRKDQKPVHISMSAALLKDKNGVPIGTVRVSRDITKEVELEEKIKEERDNLNLIFENMTDGVYSVSKEYEVEFMNKVLIDEFGIQVGGICYEVFHNREEPCPQCKNPEVMNGKTVRWEWYSRRKNKTYDLIETPLKNIDGTLSKLTIFRDITERKQAEEEIKKLLKTIETAKEAINITSADGTITYTNDAMDELFGYKKGELIGEHPSILQAGPVPEKVTERIVDAVKKEGYWEGEIHNKRKDGSEFMSYARISALKDKDGRIINYLSTQHDITERKRAEKELQETRDYLENLFKYASAPIIVWDPAFKITTFNHAFEHLTGHSAVEVLGKPPDILFPEDKREEVMNHINRALAGERWETVEIPILHTDGSVRVMLWNSATLYAEDGTTPIATIAQGEDITDRKLAEEAMRESEERYRTLFEKTSNPILIIDIKGNYIDCNEAALQLLECTRREVLTKNVSDFIPPGKEDEVLKEHTPLWAKGGTVENEYFVRGKIKIVELTISPGIWKEKRVVFGIGRDITDRKRAEEQVKASLREKDVLLREIHHRVKNNLQIISTLLYLQSGYIKDKEALEMFKDSQNRIKSMALIHDKLYQFKDLGKIDIAEYIRALATDLIHSYGVKPDGVKLKINVHEVLLGVDTALPCGLIINELVSNSLKHAFPDGKEGTIRIDLLRSVNENTFTLLVYDNGVGFPKDLDFRNTETLGLQLVITLVEQLNGTIELDRSRGTEFKITFGEV